MIPAGLSLSLLAAAGLWGCASYPPGRSPSPVGEGEVPRPTRSLPPELAALYEPLHPARDLHFELVERGALHERLRFRFETTSEVYGDLRTVEGTYYRPRGASPGRPAPLILVSPILGGAKDDYLACRVFGEWAAADGMSSFYLHQEADILQGDRDAAALDRLLRDNIIANRKALNILLEKVREIDPGRVGSLGISLGAVKNAVLIAVEPRLEANVLCLAGGDLPRILLESKERMVRRYLARRKDRGLDPAGVAEEFRRDFQTEPLRFAPYVDPARVLLFLGSLDDKVPYGTGLLLHQALGRPALKVMPLGHYTSLLAAPYMARRALTWMAARFDETR